MAHSTEQDGLRYNVWFVLGRCRVRILAGTASVLIEDFVGFLSLSRRIVMLYLDICNHRFRPQTFWFIIDQSYCNGFDQRVARQQLCKHSPTLNNRCGCVFYVACAKQRWNNGVMQTVSKQRLGKHTSALAMTYSKTETPFPWRLCRVLLREVNAVTELL
jgi:hypothetical protein